MSEPFVCFFAAHPSPLARRTALPARPMRPPSAPLTHSASPPPGAGRRRQASPPKPRAVPPHHQPPPPPPPLSPLALDVARTEAAIRLRADGAAAAGWGRRGGGRSDPPAHHRHPHDAAVAAFSDEATGRAAFAGALAGLATALGLDPAAALPLARAQPALLALPRAALVARLLALKAALPAGVDAAAVAARGPFLLADPDPAPAVAAALAQLHALMPGVPVEARLAEAALHGGSLWLSFADLSREALRRERRGGEEAGGVMDG